MPTYKVIAPCFYGDVYRTPDHPKHGAVVVEKILDPCPSYFELVKDESPKTRAARKAKAQKDAEKAAADQKEADEMFSSTAGLTETI